MLISYSLIKLLTVLNLLSSCSADAKEIESILSTFAFKFDENIGLSPLAFYFYSPDSIKREPKVSQDLKLPQIIRSNITFDCLSLEKFLNLNSNSILIQLNSETSPEIIYNDCIVPTSYLLGCFLVTEQYFLEIVNSRRIQEIFVEIIMPKLLSNSKNKRRLSASLKDFNDLVFTLDGCVGCAIYEFEYIDLLTFEDFSNLVILFLSYTQSLNKEGEFNNICDAITVSSATVKLLKYQRFEQRSLLCSENFSPLGYFKVSSIGFDDKCTDQFEELLKINLDYINACNTILGYNCKSINDLQCMNRIIEAIKGNYVMVNSLFHEKELEMKHESFKYEDGMQIKVNYTSSLVKSVKSNDLKNCGFEENSFVGDLRILLIYYSIFGDIPARIILTYKEFDCNNAEFDEEFEISLYEKVTPDIVIQTYVSHNFQYKLKDKSFLINFNPMIYYYSYYFNLINCQVKDNLCKGCFQGFYLNNNQCYQDEQNCNFYGPNLRCVECIKGYYLNPDNNCINCPENCSYCDKYSACLICKNKNYLSLNNTCLTCQENCNKCTINHCLQCEPGFTLSSRNLCIKCQIGCNSCNENNECLECASGYYLNLYQGKYICEKCGKNCEFCNKAEICDSCYNDYKPSYFNDKDCDYCPHKHCSYCESEKGECQKCENGYYLNESLECSDCKVDKCKRCSVSSDCFECLEGYILVDNDRCELCDDEFCKRCNKIGNCLECKEGFGLNDNFKCVPCFDGFCMNCPSYDKCLECRSSYFVSDQFKCADCENNCKTCTNQKQCLSCSSGFYLFNLSCISCSELFTDCDECLASTVNKCFKCRNLLMIPSDDGCKCIDGYFKGPLNNCLKCKEDCSVCTDYQICSICTAFNSTFNSISGCVCNEGFYQVKEMTSFDACMPCENHCKTCKTGTICLICEDDSFIVQGECFQCGSLIPPTAVNSFFLKSFTEVVIEFKDPVFALSCENLFGKEKIYSKKLGKDYKCEIKSENEIYIQLGTGFSLINETIEITNFYLKNPNNDCKIKIGLQYTAPLPFPVANILAPSRVLVNTEQLKIDGKVSGGGYKSPLKYEWNIYSETSEISNYDQSTESTIIIPKSILKEGIINIKLTVTNKFNLKNSIEKEVLCEINTLIIEFNTLSTFSCRASQKCEISINKITPFKYEDSFDYIWKISSGEKLLINEIELLNKPSITIKPFSFKQGTIGLTVEVKNQAGVSGSGEVFVNIINEKPVIVLDRTIGSISSQADFIIDASQSYDPNLNCKGDDNCLFFEWVCYKSKKLCDFEYEHYKSHLFIPKNKVKSKQFDSFLLKVTSIDNLQNTFLIEVDILDTSYVPSMLNKVLTEFQVPSRISLSKEFIIEANLLDNNIQDSQYTISWCLNTEENKTLSNKPTILINRNFLKPGLNYKLTFTLMGNNATFNYYYNFIVNNPPTNGDFSVTESGEALKVQFEFNALNWEDLENDIPLSYTFGYYSDESRLNLTVKQSIDSFSTYLAYLGKPMYGFVQIYDSMGDYTEKFQAISVTKLSSVSDMFDTIKGVLSSTMLNKKTVSLILAIAAGVLNEEYYETGKFSTKFLILQDAFEVCSQYLKDYIDKMEASESFLSLVSGALAELTLNPKLKSPKNVNSTVEILESLLDKIENIGIETDQAKSLYTVLENSFTYNGDLISDNITDLSNITTLCKRINKAIAINVYSEFDKSIKSRNMHTKLYRLDTYTIDNSEYSFRDVLVDFPSASTMNLNPIQEFVLSITYLSLAASDTLSQNLLIISIFSNSTDSEQNLQTNNSIHIYVPYNSKYYGKPTSCLFFDYTTQKWDDQGCSLYGHTEYSVICNCTHLSTFTAGTFNNIIKDDEKENVTKTKISQNLYGFYATFLTFIIYLIFSIFCYLKDKKLLDDNYKSAQDRDPRNCNIGKNNNMPNSNVPVDEDPNIIVNDDGEKKTYLDIRNSPVSEEKVIEPGVNEIKKEPQKFEADNIEAEKIKTVLEAIKEELKIVSIYFYTDKNYCRLYRSSLFFFKLIGVIFLISAFYYSIKLNPAKDLVVVSIICTFAILYIIQIIFNKVYKEEDLSSKEVHKVIVEELYNKNTVQLAIAFSLFTISNIVFIIGSTLLVNQMDSDLRKYWIRAMAIGLGIEIIIIPMIRVFLITFCSYLYQRCLFNRRNKNS